mmetsp:Transcript_4816/g.10043  ORF Transcript_4816/g.10043 Transcript_4816/m.10043 type:complete len:259 (+) Transcript_4816:211-987(+)
MYALLRHLIMLIPPVCVVSFDGADACDCAATVAKNPGLNRFALGKIVGEEDSDISMAIPTREFFSFTFEEYMERFFSMGVPVIVTGVGSGGGGRIFSVAGHGNPLDDEGDELKCGSLPLLVISDLLNIKSLRMEMALSPPLRKKLAAAPLSTRRCTMPSRMRTSPSLTSPDCTSRSLSAAGAFHHRSHFDPSGDCGNGLISSRSKVGGEETRTGVSTWGDQARVLEASSSQGTKISAAVKWAYKFKSGVVRAGRFSRR